MTSDVVIRAERLGKKYVIGHQSAERYTALRDVIARSARNWARSLRDMATGAANVAGDEVEEFWALKDVNFEIRRGDVVGVIGRNGAGKSTLLKVLSRITEPSEGRVEIKGRIASLLEVGTGFHPELTGRENVYLNGAILGMSQAEVRRKFDEIVAFAEIEKFLDTPVKRYSSGMYVRLAFAVAAHLEPEILIVDEVLAVGDAEFQKKCLGKMRDVAGHGRTVLFVSHNMAAIQRLCSSGLLLRSGRAERYEEVGIAVTSYIATEKISRWKLRETPLSGTRLVGICILNDRVPSDPTTIDIEIETWSERPVSVSLDVLVKDSLNNPVAFASTGTFDVETNVHLPHGLNRNCLQLHIPRTALGRYSLSVFVTKPFSTFLDRADDVVSYEVIPSSTAPKQPLSLSWQYGAVHLPLTIRTLAKHNA